MARLCRTAEQISAKFMDNDEMRNNVNIDVIVSENSSEISDNFNSQDSSAVENLQHGPSGRTT